MTKNRNKKPPRIEALFDALTFEHSGHIQAKGLSSLLKLMLIGGAYE